MSLGVQVLAEAVELAVRRLGLGYDVEIVELHHRKKIDSPSGTASRLVDAVKKVRPDVRELRGRDGDVGARTEDEMGVFGVRGGDVIGDHTVYLLGDGERLELTHRASNRDLVRSRRVARGPVFGWKKAGPLRDRRRIELSPRTPAPPKRVSAHGRRCARTGVRPRFVR